MVVPLHCFVHGLNTPLGSCVPTTISEHQIASADRYFKENPKQFKQFLSGFFQRFPDSHTTIDHILAEDDKVLVMMTGTATDSQTGKRVTIKVEDLFRIENGTIAEHWDVVDR
jgi:predicted SnoaL-like aldol condensation-catalyzing enzyme